MPKCGWLFAPLSSLMSMDTRPTISSLVLPLKGRKEKKKKEIVIRIEIEKKKKFFSVKIKRSKKFVLFDR